VSDSSNDRICTRTCSYSYVKDWRNYQINSMVFDQPAMHHNPQRDPYPKRTTSAERARVGAFELSHDVIETLQSGFRSLSWTYDGRPKPESDYGFFERNFRSLRHRFSGWVDDTRFDHFRELDKVPYGRAAREHGFQYAGNGYFYSKYEMSASMQAFKWVGELAEGSLTDWQMGDVLDGLFNGCKPGDIRGRFRVADAAQVTVLAGVVDARGTLGAYMTKGHNYPLRRLFPGEVSFDEMKSDNWWDFFRLLMLQRLLALMWGSLVGAAFSKCSGVNYDSFLVFGISGLLLVAKWTAVYGMNDFTGHETSLSTILTLCGSIALVLYSLGGNLKSVNKSKID